MQIDRKAKRYEFGNGRFDLMTDEEVRTLYSADLDALRGRMSDCVQRGESSLGLELAHQLYELWLRYPDSDFRLEVLPRSAESEEAPCTGLD